MEDGVSGYLCRPYDAQRFADGIEKLKENWETRKQMGAKNQKKVKQYCIEETKWEVLKLIQSV